MKLYLDDEREAPKDWVLVKTVEAAINMLKTGRVEEISLDHDLGNEFLNGMDVLRWLEGSYWIDNFHIPYVRIHTANVAVREKMQSAADVINVVSDI